MSPEQCLGNKLDIKVTTHRKYVTKTLTGQAPFAAENPIKVILKHVNDEPKTISDLPQDYKIPKQLEWVVMKCLAKDPNNRYQTANDLLRDLQDIRDGKQLKIKKSHVKTRSGSLERRVTCRQCFSLRGIYCLRLDSVTRGTENSASGGQNPVGINDPVKDAKRFRQQVISVFHQQRL